VVGSNRILFGTDSSFFPRGWNSTVFELQTKTLYELGIADTEVSKILRFNLETVHSERFALRLT
jgi:predicted TIM-barrel fold metal-dependent hydrolase